MSSAATRAATNIKSAPVLDLFAGVGGWDVAARSMGYDVTGIELDPIACKTRAAAGLRTVCADITTLHPSDYPVHKLLLASPPCQFFSASSPKRKIVSEKPYNVKRRTKWRTYSEQGPDLIQEPMRWARAHYPEIIAFEQVPGALPTWETFALELEAMGYSTWTGIINAADYGAQQDRSRAILMAHRSRYVSPPEKQPREGKLYPTTQTSGANSARTAASSLRKRKSVMLKSAPFGSG